MKINFFHLFCRLLPSWWERKLNVITCEKAIVTLITRTMKLANEFKLSVIRISNKTKKHCVSKVWTGHTNAGSFFCTRNRQKWIILLNYESLFFLHVSVNWPHKSAVTAFFSHNRQQGFLKLSRLAGSLLLFCLDIFKRTNGWIGRGWILTAVSFLSLNKTK